MHYRRLVAFTWHISFSARDSAAAAAAPQGPARHTVGALGTRLECAARGASMNDDLAGSAGGSDGVPPLAL